MHAPPLPLLVARPALLASVADLEEAETAHALGAEVLDLKDPRAGALGAWAPERLSAAVARLGGRGVLSATTGDLPMDPALLRAVAERVAATGVDVVKIGFFANEGRAEVLEALRPLAVRGVRLVAVLLADRDPDLLDLAPFAEAGFAGVMLDTADKRGGGLRAHLDDVRLARFVDDVHGLGLLCGLAGSLRVEDIPALARLGPDYLGFRGALCVGGRTDRLDPDAFVRVRAALDVARTTAGRSLQAA
ncbi:MAG: (5-formylfuran-3-yl)methyl phosphate synthase [Geminicoccaceae bacterium]|nr:(5-formylfuran-3-yl)methyl phosphate synthase [Geminicoccaceae bacterium]